VVWLPFTGKWVVKMALFYPQKNVSYPTIPEKQRKTSWLFLQPATVPGKLYN
jgi:hypothetical protein